MAGHIGSRNISHLSPLVDDEQDAASATYRGTGRSKRICYAKAYDRHESRRTSASIGRTPSHDISSRPSDMPYRIAPIHAVGVQMTRIDSGDIASPRPRNETRWADKDKASRAS